MFFVVTTVGQVYGVYFAFARCHGGMAAIGGAKTLVE